MTDKPITYYALTLGGAPIPYPPQPSCAFVVCPACNGRYPMAADPAAFGLTPAGAVVLNGYIEACPCCGQGHLPGVVLGVEFSA